MALVINRITYHVYIQFIYLIILPKKVGYMFFTITSGAYITWHWDWQGIRKSYVQESRSINIHVDLGNSKKYISIMPIG